MLQALGTYIESAQDPDDNPLAFKQSHKEGLFRKVQIPFANGSDKGPS